MIVHGDLSAVLLDVDIKSRMLTYWGRLCLGNKHNNIIYSLVYILDEKNIFKSEWMQTVNTTLNYCRFSGFWLNQTLPCSIETFKQSVKLRLKEMALINYQKEENALYIVSLKQRLCLKIIRKIYQISWESSLQC